MAILCKDEILLRVIVLGRLYAPLPDTAARALGAGVGSADTSQNGLCVFCVGLLYGPPLQLWVPCGALPYVCSVLVPCVALPSDGGSPAGPPLCVGLQWVEPSPPVFPLSVTCLRCHSPTLRVEYVFTYSCDAATRI